MKLLLLLIIVFGLSSEAYAIPTDDSFLINVSDLNKNVGNLINKYGCLFEGYSDRGLVVWDCRHKITKVCSQYIYLYIEDYSLYYYDEFTFNWVKAKEYYD